MAQPKDVVRSLAFNARRRTLVGATAQGRVCFWHFIGSRAAVSSGSGSGSGSGNSSGSGSGSGSAGGVQLAAIEPSESDWDVLPPVSMGGAQQGGIEALEWGASGDSGLLCVRMAQARARVGGREAHSANHWRSNGAMNVSCQSSLEFCFLVKIL